MMKETLSASAMFYSKLSADTVKCELCNFYCIIPNHEKGYCNAYENRNGKLFSLTYNRPISLAPMLAPAENYLLDPSEPLPQILLSSLTRTLWVSTAFCNFRCPFCLSQLGSIQEVKYGFPREKRDIIGPFFSGLKGMGDGESFVVEMTAQDVVNTAMSLGCQTIRFALNECTLFFEYMLEIARLAKQQCLQIWVETNGYMTLKPVEVLSAFIDQAIIGFKRQSNAEFYHQMGINDVEPIWQTAKKFRDLGVPLWITDVIMEDDDYNATVEFCYKIAQVFGHDQVLFFESCRRISQGALLLPSKERIEKFGWSLAAAHEAGLTNCYLR
jgi:pyruvate formate lyase activating enzyme